MLTLPDHPSVRHDPVADAVIVQVRPGVSYRTEIIDALRVADYDVDGALLFVELVNVSHGIRLEDLPEQEVVRRALRTAGHDVDGPGPAPRPA